MSDLGRLLSKGGRMKQVFILILCSVLFAPVLFAISITDYWVPISQSRVCLLQFNYKFAQDTAGVITDDNGMLLSDFEQFYSSLPFGYDLIVKADVERGRDSTNRALLGYNLQSGFQLNKYLFDKLSFFGFGKSSLTIEKPKANDTTSIKLDITAGGGYGRFVVATPLARALRVQEELEKVGILVEPLSDAGLLTLAEQLDSTVIKKYIQSYDYWERKYLGDLERILKESGVLREGELGSVGTIIVNDVLNEQILERYYGYQAALGFGYELLDLNVPADTIISPERNLYAELTFNYARPIGLRSQFAEFFTLQAPVTGADFGKRVSIKDLRLQYSYELSNKLEFLVSYWIPPGDIVRSDTTHTWNFQLEHRLDLSLLYYLVNKLNFTNTISLSLPSKARRPGITVSAGLRYRIF
jgi:hypothetical protein